MTKFVVNGREVNSEQPGDTPLGVPIHQIRPDPVLNTPVQGRWVGQNQASFPLVKSVEDIP